MKKIFTLAIALIATFGVTSAQEKVLHLNMTDGQTIEYEVSRIKNITYADSPWTSLGYCLYGEDFIGSLLWPSGEEIGYFCCEYYVEVQENTDKPGLYRLVNPYGPNVYPYTSYTTYDTKNYYYIEINATDPEGVYIEYQDTGMRWDSFGEVYVYSYAGMYHDQGYSWDAIKESGCCGTLNNGVITFPEDALFTALPEYVSGYYYANSNNKFKLDLNDKNETMGIKDITRPILGDKDTSFSVNVMVCVEKIDEFKSIKK